MRRLTSANQTGGIQRPCPRQAPSFLSGSLNEGSRKPCERNHSVTQELLVNSGHRLLPSTVKMGQSAKAPHLRCHLWILQQHQRVLMIRCEHPITERFANLVL